MNIVATVAASIGGTFLVGGLLIAVQYFLTLRDPEIHLIRSGYRGPVVIVYDRPDGKPAKYEDGARVLEIPESGILRTRMKSPGSGWARPGTIRYFYVDEHGEREEIPWVQWREQMVDETKTYIFGSGGNMAEPDPFEMYVVGTVREYNDSVSDLKHKMVKAAISIEEHRLPSEIYILPEGYQGPVAIFYSRLEGAPAKYKGDVRIYEVPPDGVLYTQLNPPAAENMRSSARRFYYVSAGGDSTELKEIGFSEEVPDTVNVYVRGGGVMGLGQSAQKVTRYIVGTSRNLNDSLLQATNKLIRERWRKER